MFNAHSRLLDNDHRLAFLVLFGAVATLAILPFALWRLSQGQWLAGLLELLMVSTFAALVWFAWRHRRITLVARVISMIITLGCLALTPMIGPLAYFWGYAVAVSNLMLTGRKIGICLNLVLLPGILALQGAASTPLEGVTFLVTGLIVSIYAYIFALAADQQRRKLEALAAYDGLTGASNRRMMEYELQDAFDHANAHGATYSLAILDIDHFKAINDTFGHEAGDQALVSLAQLLTRSLRSKDRLYRMGGEEFVILFPNTDTASIGRVLGRIRSTLCEEFRGPGGPITVSIGASTTLESDESWHHWLGRADEALYIAKASGRDQVRLAGESGHLTRPRASRRRRSDRPVSDPMRRLA